MRLAPPPNLMDRIDPDRGKGCIRLLSLHPRWQIGTVLIVEETKLAAARHPLPAVSRPYADQLIRDGRAVWLRKPEGE
jgi:hypothetical protein